MFDKGDISTSGEPEAIRGSILEQLGTSQGCRVPWLNEDSWSCWPTCSKFSKLSPWFFVIVVQQNDLRKKRLLEICEWLRFLPYDPQQLVFYELYSMGVSGIEPRRISSPNGESLRFPCCCQMMCCCPSSFALATPICRMWNKIHVKLQSGNDIIRKATTPCDCVRILMKQLCWSLLFCFQTLGPKNSMRISGATNWWFCMILLRFAQNTPGASCVLQDFRYQRRFWKVPQEDWTVFHFMSFLRDRLCWILEALSWWKKRTQGVEVWLERRCFDTSAPMVVSRSNMAPDIRCLSTGDFMMTNP